MKEPKMPETFPNDSQVRIPSMWIPHSASNQLYRRIEAIDYKTHITEDISISRLGNHRVPVTKDGLISINTPDRAEVKFVDSLFFAFKVYDGYSLMVRLPKNISGLAIYGAMLTSDNAIVIPSESEAVGFSLNLEKGKASADFYDMNGNDAGEIGRLGVKALVCTALPKALV